MKTRRKSKNRRKKVGTKTEKRKKEKSNKTNEMPQEEMETSTNLKRRSDSGYSITEGEGGKSNLKICQQKQLRKQRPAQIIPPPQQPKYTPADPTKLPLSPTPPPLSPISTFKLLPFGNKRFTININIEH